MTGGLFDVTHWRSLVTKEPLCKAPCDQPQTNEREQVDCLSCIYELQKMKKHNQMKGS